jgi:thiamine-phosphate pyrophosphorylase
VSALSNSPAARKAPILCYVTGGRDLYLSTSSDFSSALIQKIAAVASAGVDWIQLREKHLFARELSNLAREGSRRAPVCAGGGRARPRIIVNDRLDVAIAERADGVHLGENGLPVNEAKLFLESLRVAQPLLFTPTLEEPVPALPALGLPVTAAPVPPSPTPALFVTAQTAPKNFLLGVSCHSLEGAKAAEREGASYIFFGPIFATPSKAAFGQPQGTVRLAEVCLSVSIQVLAIGGITVENAAVCIQAGAAGIAAIRLFQDAPDASAIVKELRQRTA